MSKQQPDPSPAAPLAVEIKLREKRTNVVSFRSPEILDRLLERQAREGFTTKSNYIRRVLQRHFLDQIRRRMRERRAA